MESIEVHTIATPDLHEPTLIEGLPGAGLVGTLCANHLVETLDARPVRRIYSEHFPPFVSISDDAIATFDPLTVHAIEVGGQDLLVLTGGTQAKDSVGQFRLTETVLDIAEDFGATDAFALGGSVLGEPVEDHHVVGAVADGCSHLREPLEAAGVSFHPEEIPETIGGVSGLLLGLSPQRDITAASLSGTTSGYIVDPLAAWVVLKALRDILEISVDLTTFREEPKQKQESVRHIHKVLQMNIQEQQDSDDSLRYFS